MSIYEKPTRKRDKISLIASMISFIAGMVMSPLEFVTIPIWCIAAVLTGIAAKKNFKVLFNIIFLILALLGIIYTFWLMHLSPYHDNISVGFEF